MTASDNGDNATVPEATHLREISALQWKSGAAAWLGWMFDGLDMHLYTLVATPFVAQLLGVERLDPAVARYSSWIQAAFLVGWALGGSVFGRLGDRLGRSRTLVLTILTYAGFTGLSFFAQTWWQLMLFRFMAALGIGGEWAVGAALLAETWPRRWRPWLAAVLQTGVNLGIMLASFAVYLLADFPPRTVFLVGVLPALLVLWIRRAVPETEAWHAAQSATTEPAPHVLDLFRGPVRRVTLLALLVCAFSLTGHWAFIFWCSQHLRSLPDLVSWSDAERSQYVSKAMTLVMVASIVGNFLAAGLAKQLGYRRSMVLLFLAYFAAMACTYGIPREHESILYWIPAMGASSGVFGLFTMYLPPLFPTLLRTTGAGFCYNFGRIAAAAGTVYFGLYASVGDFRASLFSAGMLFIPAAILALFLPELHDGDGPSRRDAEDAEKKEF